MSRTGIRPHTWKVQGEIPHKQYLAFLQMRAQANFRKETFQLTFEDFQELWKEHWANKGRGNDQYCLSRHDPLGEWTMNNVVCMPRIDHLRRQKHLQDSRKK